MKTGIVLYFLSTRGFGIILSDDKEIFFHYSELPGKDYKTINPGQSVEFDLYLDPKDPSRYIARNIVKLS